MVYKCRATITEIVRSHSFPPLHKQAIAVHSYKMKYSTKSLLFTAALASTAAAAPVLSTIRSALTSKSYWTTAAASDKPVNEVVYAQAGGTFAVLHFNNEPGKFSTEGRMDPIVSPGMNSSHAHGIMGGSNFGLTVEGDQLLGSSCTNAKIANDKSNYWVAPIYFQSPTDGKFKQVPLYYMNVYYL